MENANLVALWKFFINHSTQWIFDIMIKEITKQDSLSIDRACDFYFLSRCLIKRPFFETLFFAKKNELDILIEDFRSIDCHTP